MKKVELLSPAGSFEALKAAVNNGADAVYLGGTAFSARAFANNFTNDEIVEAINYCHLRNVKVYVTINTLLNEHEIDGAYKQAEFLYKNHVDAILVQDLGLYYRIKTNLKNLELHASTQMHVHNVEGVKTCKKLGFNRVVIARESSLNLIKEACKQDIEIECFVHGAICVSYSGQCLMSSITKNRSANKGMCAQCCRLKYELYEDGLKIKTDTDYLLSPKDMFLLEDIPSLIEAGVSSFKIEGRMKSPSYVAYVTSIYRKAIDAYYENQKFSFSNEIERNLKVLFNRGFTNTYLGNTNQELFNNKRPNHMGVEIGRVIDIKGKNVYIKLHDTVNQFDGIRILSNNDDGLILNKLEVNGKLVSKALKDDVIKVSLDSRVNINDIVVKTLDKKFDDILNNYTNKLIDLDLNIIVKPNSPLSIEAFIDSNKYVYQSKILLENAINHPLTKENIINTFSKCDNHPYKLCNINVEIKDSFLSLKELNQIRREYYEFLDSKRLETKDKVVNQLDLKLKDIEIKECINPLIENTSSKYSFLDVINTDSIYPNNSVVVSEIGGLLLENSKIAYHTLNVTNSYAYEFLLRLGFDNVILSLELDGKTIDALIDGFFTRNRIKIKPYVFEKGKRTLMNISRNPFSLYMKNNHKYTLSDGKNDYFINDYKEYIKLTEISEFLLKNKPTNKYLSFIKENT